MNPRNQFATNRIPVDVGRYHLFKAPNRHAEYIDMRRFNPIELVIVLTCVAAATIATADADPESFEDALGPKLKDGWRWVHETPNAWRTDEHGLSILALPGTVWGKPNSGRNQLVRAAPAGDLATEVTVEMAPDNPPRWEQAGLLWYIDDDHFVKLVKEFEHGKWMIVMGREWEARAKPLCVIPIEDGPVRLRLEVRGDQVIGRYRIGEGEWKHAATCELAAKDTRHVALHAQRGPKNAEHWVRFRDLTIAPLHDE